MNNWMLDNFIYFLCMIAISSLAITVYVHVHVIGKAFQELKIDDEYDF